MLSRHSIIYSLSTIHHLYKVDIRYQDPGSKIRIILVLYLYFVLYAVYAMLCSPTRPAYCRLLSVVAVERYNTTVIHRHLLRPRQSTYRLTSAALRVPPTPTTFYLISLSVLCTLYFELCTMGLELQYYQVRERLK
ncbi:hypothetical protein L228DRAFT_263208 [Xylona heveae TC161]|uniref:Uncharacterized protein n=1 Tax=Xylona heveae (strain CBS 132557 / TC161) TaxID=1328760 RepID=A0A165A2I8_XYLHT|nr:hypothetical protein L228DRAFT_263208 [Xylona heveae TC161]KZF19864.1 hypothetical protein L228DRAFT_263208 [Xylona heveae TC161]